MLTSELIKKLQEEMDRYGDLPIAIYSDYEQAQMICEGVERAPIDDREGYVIEIYGDDYL
jgi:cbb3-type cytochrome oxidase cytochrome c subunit